MYSDWVLALRMLRRETGGRIQRALMIDLDVHQASCPVPAFAASITFHLLTVLEDPRDLMCSGWLPPLSGGQWLHTSVLEPCGSAAGAFVPRRRTGQDISLCLGYSYHSVQSSKASWASWVWVISGDLRGALGAGRAMGTSGTSCTSATRTCSSWTSTTRTSGPGTRRPRRRSGLRAPSATVMARIMYTRHIYRSFTCTNYVWMLIMIQVDDRYHNNQSSTLFKCSFSISSKAFCVCTILILCV